MLLPREDEWSPPLKSSIERTFSSESNLVISIVRANTLPPLDTDSVTSRRSGRVRKLHGGRLRAALVQEPTCAGAPAS